MKIIIATIKSWNIENAKILQKQHLGIHEIKIIDNKEEFVLEKIKSFQPDIIFIPHWSYIIPKEIYENYKCVVFHMTDLPFGRGGSPLQNLIVRGYKETKISAIKVTKEIDAGPIYLKECLDLSGSAEDIFKRASDVIFSKMIPKFLLEDIVPCEQDGDIVSFKRRTPAESELKEEMDMETIYDYIRMLDAEGYPNAYINLGTKKVAFKNVKWCGNKLHAEVEILEENQ